MKNEQLTQEIGRQWSKLDVLKDDIQKLFNLIDIMLVRIKTLEDHCECEECDCLNGDSWDFQDE